MVTDGKSHYYGHRARLKAKFAENPAALADYELLEMLLGYVIPRKDVKPLAKDMLARAGSLAGLLSCDFSGVKGAGFQTELFLAAVRELCDRCAKDKVKTAGNLSNPEDIYNFLKFSIAMGSKESFAVIYLNGKHGLLSHEIMSRGTVNSAQVFPREVAESAVRAGASYAVIAHNHPSGSLEPSKEDIDITARIKRALWTLDIILLDHLIITKNSYSSFFAMGLLDRTDRL